MLSKLTKIIVHKQSHFNAPLLFHPKNSFANLLKFLRKTFGLVVKLSNSIQQFHSLYILLKTITPFLSPDDSTKLKEAPSKDIPTTFSTLYYMVWTQQSIFRCRHRACVFLKTKSVSNSSCFKKFMLFNIARNSCFSRFPKICSIFLKNHLKLITNF